MSCIRIIFLLIVAIVFLQSCATSGPPASAIQVQKAQQFLTFPNHANVYIHREYFFQASGITMHVTANNKQLGLLTADDYINLKATPGAHTFNMNWDIAERRNQAAVFNLNVQPNEIVIISCSVSGEDPRRSPHTIYCKVYRNNSPSDQTDYMAFKAKIMNDKMVATNVHLIDNGKHPPFDKAKQTNTIQAYQNYIKQYPNSSLMPQARNSLATLQAKEKAKQAAIKKKNEFKMLIATQKCKLKEKNWIYKSRSCSKGFAHGKGEAVHMDGLLSYKGNFTNGVRAAGILSADNVPLYDGPILDGKPHGKAICFHDNEPEECKYYNGKRVDTLYKQRLELAKQREEMQQMRVEMNKNMQDIKTQNAQMNAKGKGSGGNALEDKLIDSAIDKGMEKLFDELF